MNTMKDVLKNRDGMNEVEATREMESARESLYDILENGGDYGDVENMMLDDYGLEMDYIFDLLI